MPDQSDIRKKRNHTHPQPEPEVPQRSGTAVGSLEGVVGDASTAVTRSGEDTRRRGWFWHWNNIVTQYAPMIGLKGVGLLNSYTVWTDRREESPHRGYAFPSQQSEADFYGEDRAELITINKILVALDLIEIRKEMVPRTDEKGRRWKVPHNFYRVKDHSDDFGLTARDVMKVAELADRDRAVYRYVRRMFSPRFAPIDSQNVWHGILEDVRKTPTWQQLATRTERDESKASARSKAGHAARRASAGESGFFAPDAGDSRESEATARDSAIDSATGDSNPGIAAAETSVAPSNTGYGTAVDETNTGFDRDLESDVAGSNIAGPTSVQPTNSTYYQSITTTTTGQDDDRIDHWSKRVPDTQRAETLALQRFEEANERESTAAERRLLRQLATRFEPVATGSGSDSWSWLAFAIDDAVAAGSRFVAPKRLREILSRWERDGLPAAYREGDAALAQGAPQPVTTSEGPSHRPRKDIGRVAAETNPDGGAPFVAPVFLIEACGMTSRQVWSAVLADIRFSGTIGQSDVSTWLRGAALLAMTDADGLVLGVPHELALRRASGRYLGAIRQAVQRVTGLALPVKVVLFRDWAA